MQCYHKSVLLNEVVEVFKDVDGIIVDATLGFGGHSRAILQNNEKVKIIACDKDDDSIRFCKENMKEFGDRIEIHKSNFSEILNILGDRKNKIKGILADIGLSSFQIDTNERGFGLNSDYLDMRMDQNNSLSALEIVNNYDKNNLIRIFKNYGQVNRAKFLSEKIINYRNIKKIESAKELSNIIGRKLNRNSGASEATLVFQAIRIEINKELLELEQLLDSVQNTKFENELIVAIISFHSLEDKIIKDRFKFWSKDCICDEKSLRCYCGSNNSRGNILNKKVIMASQKEVNDNSRSKCAKMRIFNFKG